MKVLDTYMEKAKDTLANKPLTVGWFLAFTAMEIAVFVIQGGRCL